VSYKALPTLQNERCEAFPARVKGLGGFDVGIRVAVSRTPRRQPQSHRRPGGIHASFAFLPRRSAYLWREFRLGGRWRRPQAPTI
jgi:hypothetical protein